MGKKRKRDKVLKGRPVLWTVKGAVKRLQQVEAGLKEANPHLPMSVSDNRPTPPGGWQPLPGPTLEQQTGRDRLFEAVWQVIKTWDVGVPAAYSGHCGATGNHAAVIAKAVRDKIIIPRAECDQAFTPLWSVFQQALAQTQSGKGKERHNQRDEPFTDQQIVRFGDWLGSNHGQVFQAVKKAVESTKLPRERARAELLGAIVYLGAAVLVLDRQPIADPFVRPTNLAEALCDNFNHRMQAEQERATTAFSRNRGTVGPQADLKQANDWGERTKRKRAK